MPFPAIPPEANYHQIDSVVNDYYERILTLNTESRDNELNRCHLVVMIQGEFTFVYRLVKKLEAAGIPCVAACAERIAEETKEPDGAARKESVFCFVRFREYFEL